MYYVLGKASTFYMSSKPIYTYSGMEMGDPPGTPLHTRAVFSHVIYGTIVHSMDHIALQLQSSYQPHTPATNKPVTRLMACEKLVIYGDIA